jgi:hypothetical protein
MSGKKKKKRKKIGKFILHGSGGCGSGLLIVFLVSLERADQGGSNGGGIMEIGGVLAEI